MAQLAIATVGAVVGSAFGPLGTQVGWVVGSLVGSQFGPKQNTQGPRLSDLKVTSGAYGDVIPWGAGHPRLPGQVWWASQRLEVSQTTEQGKGGGPTSTTYTYVVNILYGLVDREIVGVSRIWSNGKLIWTAHVDSDEDSQTASQNDAPWDRITVYTGASDQLPDPTYEAAVTNAPAYRGRGSVFIEGLQLGNSGVIPNLTFETVISGAIVNYDKGFLSQWDSLTDATHVDTQLGPEPVLSGGAALQSSVKKWGTNALYVPAPGAAITSILTPVNNDHAGKSWRFECWVYWTGDSGSYPAINIASAGTGRGVSFARHGTFGAYYGGCSSSVSGTSGVFGDASDRPPINTWVHTAIEQLYGDRVRIYDSATGGEVADFGATIHVFTNADMGEVRVQNNVFSAPFYVDSMLFRWFEADEEDLLYVNGYSVPDGPFEPPPYAYQTVEPYDDTLQNVVEDLCERSGLSAGQIDASGLAAITKPVRSLAVGTVPPARAVLEQLASGYFFECYATDKLYFVPRGGSVVDAIDADDRATGNEQAEAESLPMTIGSNAEISAQVSVSYVNVDADYNTAAEHSDRLLTGQVNTSAVQLPIGFTSAEAKGIADAMVMDGYASRITGQVSLPVAYADLLPTNVVTVPDDDGNTYRVRLVRRTDELNRLIFEWVLDDASAIESAGITSEDYTPTLDVALPGVTVMELLDVPLLRDADNTLGHYVAASSTSESWPGASIQRSVDDVTYAEAAVVAERAVMGRTTTTLGTWTGGVVFDELNTVTVDVGDGELSSSTRAAMLLDTSINALMVGDELIRFRDRTGGSGVYTVSGLLRGQKGTEWAVGTHAEGERVVLMQTQGLRYVSIDLPSLETERYYKGVTRGRALSSASTENFTCEGVSLTPLAPVHVRREVDTSSGTVLTWTRRTRLAYTFTGPAGSVVPLGELTEAYSVDVVLDDEVVRTISATSPTCTYTAAQQTADGVSGATDIRFDVYQISAVVGRGYAASLETTGSVTPQPQIATLTVGGSWATGGARYATHGGVTYGHTSAGGDTDLDGIADSLAAVIDAAASYSAVAAGPVVSVTGPMSLAFPVIAGVSAGDNTTTWNITQTASDTVAGVGNQIHFGWKNLGDPAGTNAYPFGMQFNLLVQRLDPPLNLFYSVTNADAGGFTDYRILPGLPGAISYEVSASGDALTYGFSLTPNDGPNGSSTLTTPASEPYNWTLQVSASIPAVSGLAGNTATGVTPATLRPQIVTLTLAGTPVTGRIYRATLGGVDFDYPAGGGDTTMALVATGLASVIDANANYIAAAVGAVITITHASNNVPFTYSATVIPSTVTLTAAITQEAA
jgi:hypothetical protein